MLMVKSNAADYKITKARMHSESHGAAADRPKQKTVKICTLPEDVAFSS